MIKLKKIIISRYKCFEEQQSVEIENNITTVVGMNESGKSALLESIAKSNYFDDDPKFKFNKDLDYTRKYKKQLDKSGEIPEILTSHVVLSDKLIEMIANEVGKGVFNQKELIYSTKSDNTRSYILKSNYEKFLDHNFSKIENYNDIKGKLIDIKTQTEFNSFLTELSDETVKQELAQYAKYYENKWNWDNPVKEYIARKMIDPNLPKFLYYDEYYSLPSKIKIEDLQGNNLPEGSLKTSKALFELADINIPELIQSNNFETYIAELEATSIEITRKLFEYWTTNKNLRIKFLIDKQIVNNSQIPILHIRVENTAHMMTLPLHNRSKGFNWFFSFIVWFSKIQEDKESNYVLLLDEPGLNLHASAQADLLRFIEDLSKDYQIIYTTHSPFMVETEHLNRIRTIRETDDGSFITTVEKEKDPRTLFPLQASLGYDIAQNLFISKHNLLVEGPADLLYLSIMTNVLEDLGKAGLKDDVTIVPVGGLDKVVTFISLLKGSKLNIVCLLDTFDDKSSKQKLDDMVKYKIIRKKNIRFFNEFSSTGGKESDIEDMFEKSEYLDLFNKSFPGHPDINEADLSKRIKKIIKQINHFLDIKNFNHYRPANELAKLGVEPETFSNSTIDRFEKMFEEINKRF